MSNRAVRVLLNSNRELNRVTLRNCNTFARAQLLQPCPTLCDPMDCSLAGSSVHGDSPGKNSGVVCHTLLQVIFPGIKPVSPASQVNSLPLSYQGSPRDCNNYHLLNATLYVHYHLMYISILPTLKLWETKVQKG